MVFQKVLKGIQGINEVEARKTLNSGILCNWWRLKERITVQEKKDILVEKNIDLHLNHYDEILPPTHLYSGLGSTYGDVSPFISTTAGAVQRDKFYRTNIIYDPFMTAIRFATNDFMSSGFIFYCYLVTIGKKAVELEQFSEEVRELHVYTDFLQYHHEGEIMAKIIIPSVQIEMAVEYDGPSALTDLEAGLMPSPKTVLNNISYLPPERYSNIKELL